MPKGTISFETPDWVNDPESIDVPVYDPAELDKPGYKTVGPNGEVVAARLATAESSPERAVKVVGPNGNVWSLDATARSRLDGFEDGEWPDDWIDTTGSYGLTTNALAGGYSLECTSSPGRAIKTGSTTPRGWDYRVRVVVGDADAEAWLLTNVQDPNAAFDGCYAAVLDAGLDELRLRKLTSSGTTDLDNESVSGGIDPGNEYDLVLETAESGGVQARIELPDGTWLENTPWITDGEFDGGYIGVNTTSGGEGTRYDNLRQLPRDS